MLNPNSADAAPSIQGRTLLAVARVALALVFIYSGFGKLTGFPAFAAYLSSMSVPVPGLSAVVTIVVELGVGTCLAIGYRARWAAWILAAFTVAASGIGHPFWKGGPAADADLLHALKNLAMFGGLLAVSLAQSAVDLVQRRRAGKQPHLVQKPAARHE